MTTTKLETTPLEGITEADLAWWLEKIPTLDWVFAVTYAEGAPHEYVADRAEGMRPDDFVRACRVIRTFGEPQKFFRSTRTYLVHDGWKYWDMEGDDPGTCGLINRGRADHVYGVQTTPRTRSPAPTPYDPIATFWDARHSSRPDERAAYLAAIREVTGGYRKYRTLDLGAGTGFALDLGAVEAVRLTAIDPSQAMLNELVRKHPLVARVEPFMFAEARARRVLGGTRFDLIVALGGSASYLSAEDYAALPDCGRGRFVLASYADGEGPITRDLSDAELNSARVNLRSFAFEHAGTTERHGRFEIAKVGVSE